VPAGAVVDSRWRFNGIDDHGRAFLELVIGRLIKGDQLGIELVIVLVNGHVERPAEPVLAHVYLHLDIMLKLGFADALPLQLLKRLVVMGLELTQHRLVWDLRNTKDDAVHPATEVALVPIDPKLITFLVKLPD